MLATAPSAFCRRKTRLFSIVTLICQLNNLINIYACLPVRSLLQNKSWGLSSKDNVYLPSCASTQQRQHPPTPTSFGVIHGIRSSQAANLSWYLSSFIKYYLQFLLIFLYSSCSDHAIDLVVNFFVTLKTIIHKNTQDLSCMSFLLRFSLLLKVLNSLITIRITNLIRLDDIFLTDWGVLFFYVIVFQCGAVSYVIKAVSFKKKSVFYTSHGITVKKY